MNVQQIKTKLYLKTRKKPICLIFDSEDQITRLIAELDGLSVMRLGNVVFKTTDFKYMEIEED